jgi:Glyoxalase-like domain
MEAGTPAVRLRQAVLVASELEPVTALLTASLGLGEPFRDPGVAEFGLANVVFAIGDCFLEVVSPTRPGTAAGRQLQRAGGDGGYMVLFDLEDLDGARARAELLGVRTVWQIDLPDISGTHLHPSDVPGAIVSLDRSRPYGTWRWGGPAWTGRRGAGAPGRLTGITVAVADPPAAAARWAQVLGVAPVAGDPSALACGEAEVRFAPAAAGAAEGIVEIAVALPAPVRAGRRRIDVGAAAIVLSDL